ncbi:hypothetical protein [Blastococcus sp. PRF04-17]|uniref:hypothetical protein n=1 Tax=Blastococcus sp. PRF04-17 TaxID=2933797 RepID=UPI001FF4D418|nr:hypothetical protein [Blastococcus sp. PRF04-17]UOY03700.1 hypothetical protein MVA48_10375 [Blastococcus sp. PRF04-17]
MEPIVRAHAQGIARSLTVESWLAYLAYLLSVFDSIRASELRDGLTELLGPAGCRWLNLVDQAGQQLPPERLRYMCRITEYNLGSDRPRRPGEEPLTEAERQLRHQQLLDVMNDILVGWIPADLPHGDLLVFDATGHETPSRPLDKELREALAAEASPDLLLVEERRLPAEQQARLRRQRTHRAVGARYGHATPTNAQAKKMIGGLHIHTSRLGTVEPTDDPPPLFMPAVYATPAAGYSPWHMLTDQVERVEVRFPGEYTVGADRDYSKAIDLFGWLRERGTQFVLDLTEQLLEGRGAFRGGLLYQGNILCPATPQHLRNPGPRPTAREHGQPNPEKAAWEARLAAQMPYRAHIRSVRDDGINVSCPALGPSPKCQCRLRGTVDPRLDLPVVLDPPPALEHTICTQSTIFVPDTENPLRQTLPWGRADWDRLYGRARAAIEGVHGELKHPDGRNLTRWVTGTSYVTVIAIVIALDLALINLAKIQAWVATHRDTHAVARRLAADVLFAPPADAREWLYSELRRQR